MYMFLYVILGVLELNTMICQTPKPCYTPKGTPEWIPYCEEEFKPYIGKVFRSLDVGIHFYKEYAKKCGFVDRMGTQNF